MDNGHDQLDKIYSNNEFLNIDIDIDILHILIIKNGIMCKSINSLLILELKKENFRSFKSYITIHLSICQKKFLSTYSNTYYIICTDLTCAVYLISDTSHIAFLFVCLLLSTFYIVQWISTVLLFKTDTAQSNLYKILKLDFLWSLYRYLTMIQKHFWNSINVCCSGTHIQHST